MSASHLQKLGLSVQEDETGTTAEFEPDSAFINPVNRQLLSKISFTVMGDRLVVIDPPALVGSPPVAITRLERPADLEEQLGAALNEIIASVQRRTSELQKLGISSRVDPESLVLAAEVETGDYDFLLGSDKRGNMRVTSAMKDGESVSLPESVTFDLSEFRERGALLSYLRALAGDQDGTTVELEAEPAPQAVTFAELVQAFGDRAVLPPTSSLETLVTIEVGDERLRFAAARVTGRTFRGLLAGSRGKLWAERFELDDFPGVAALVAEVLSVPLEEVRVLGQEES